MSNGDNATDGGFSDRVSLLISVLALVASGVALYYQFWQGPIVRAYPSRMIYLLP